MADREFSAGGIVIKLEGEKPKVLLIKDSYGRWTWPKGKIDKGETSSEAAIREIGEETGLKDIELIDKLGETQYFYRLKGRSIFKKVYIYLFLLKKEQDLKILHEEIQDGAWFTPLEALEKVAYKGSKDLLGKAIKIFSKRG
ncbi:NUDIX hydrolase [Candidatus Omnitrophota bacterium]